MSFACYSVNIGCRMLQSVNNERHITVSRSVMCDGVSRMSVLLTHSLI